MDVMILNTDLDAVAIVDTYESFIWTDRYYAYGDFELYEAMRDGLVLGYNYGHEMLNNLY